MKELLSTPLCHTPWINQMGYIKVKAQLPGIYGSKLTRVQGRSLRTRAVYIAINPWQLSFNYYILLEFDNTDTLYHFHVQIAKMQYSQMYFIQNRRKMYV